MSKHKKSNTVQLYLNESSTSSLNWQVSKQATRHSSKPKIEQAQFKSQIGDTPYKVISPKLSSSSSGPISQSRNQLRKQMSMPDNHHYEDSGNDSVIETIQIELLDETAIPNIYKNLTLMQDEISNSRLIDINLFVLKKWHTELLKTAQDMTEITKQMINEQSQKIESKKQRIDLEKILSEEKVKRLDAEMRSSKTIQEQEKMIGELNLKLYELEQQYTKIFQE